MKKRICMITTGGTIASQAAGDGLTPTLGSADILRLLPAAGRALRRGNRSRCAASTART